jgi:hypothetical protein
MQAEPSAPVVPLIHLHEVIRGLALGENVLTGHDKHVELLVACNVMEYVCVGQLVHDESPMTSL